MKCTPPPAPANAPSQTVTLTVGTAGHIDHGKTQLVKFLTGCNTDTLPEEMARGMTIDLGFATCELPNRRRVGIVDVPGHERFIHNMVAGATGIDAVVLVVAADDGIMPQTIEHLHIVRLLGIRSGMVAVTKTDLVEPDRVAEVVAAVRNLVAGTFLADAPITPISTKTGDGFSEFYDAFVQTVDRTAQRDASGGFRLHVERAFVLKGRGLIISGIPCSGAVRLGDTLELLPQGLERKVRGLQVYGADAERGQAGECVALNLGDLSKDDVKRGMVLAAPGYFTPTRFINAHFHALPGLERPIRPRTGVRFHVGTADVPGHLVLPTLQSLAPGQEAYVQIQLQRPVVAAPGDFYVVRELSPARTIGGGTVVVPETKRLRRSQGTWSAEVARREEASLTPEAAVAYALNQAAPVPLALAELARQAFLSEDATRLAANAAVQAGTMIALPGNRYVTPATVAAAGEELRQTLAGLHDKAPLSLGFPKKDVVLPLKQDKLVTEQALANLLAARTIVLTDHGYRLPERAPQLSEKQARLAAAVEDLLRKGRFAAPRPDELPALIGIPAPLLKPVLDHLAQAGILVVLDPKVTLHRDCLAEARRVLVEWLGAHPTIEAGQYKELLQTSRKFAIPLLEYFDRTGLTRRVGDQRVLRPPPAKV